MTLRALALLLALAPVAAAECLHYEPAVVTLRGRLHLRTFPGPPNYESVVRGDRAERALLLDLDDPVCVAADPSDMVNDEAEAGVRRLHLVANSHLVDEPKRLVGRRVVVTGSLFHAHTAHHRTAVLIYPSAVDPDPTRESPRRP